MVGNDEREAPAGAFHWFVAYVVLLTIRIDVHGALSACSHLVPQGYQVLILRQVGIGKDGFPPHLCGVRMYQEASVATKEHEVCPVVGAFEVIDGLCQLLEGEVGRDDARQPSVLQVERLAVGGDSLVGVEGACGVLTEGVYPASPAGLDGSAVPHLVEIFIVGLNDGDDGVAIIQSIDGEIASVLWEDARLGADGAAVHVRVLHDDAARDVEQRVGLEVLFDIPDVGIGRFLYRNHEVPHAELRRSEGTGRTFCHFLVYKVARLHVEYAYRQSQDDE